LERDIAKLARALVAELEHHGAGRLPCCHRCGHSSGDLTPDDAKTACEQVGGTSSPA